MPDSEITQSSSIKSSEDTQLSSPALGLGESLEAVQQQQKNNKILWGIFGLLLVLVLGVIFILPKLVSPADAEASPVVVVNVPSPQTTATSQITPFQEAQILAQRENAQNALASLLELQDMLQEKNIENWAQDDLNNAIVFATSGDNSYSQQQFIQAEQAYLSGVAILQTVEADLPNYFSTYLQAGYAAIEAGNPDQAQRALLVATQIDPTSTEAGNAYQRSQVLSQVLELLKAGQELHENNLLEEASDYYQQALAIDSDHSASIEAFTKVKTDILDRDFTQLMSQGFEAIQADSALKAQTFFEQALALKPSSEQAGTALTQAKDQITFSAITTHLNAAQNFINTEQWQQALSEYDDALLIDPNLVTAVEGRNLTNSRNNLDQYLQNTIAIPLRLAETSVYQQAISIYRDANNLQDKGPRLQEQLQKLNLLLEQITRQVNVSFVSDGLTNVQLLRTSNLGAFTSTSLDLKPGSYVAIGVRDGFRDVREEFIVPINGEAPVITVSCKEAI